MYLSGLQMLLALVLPFTNVAEGSTQGRTQAGQPQHTLVHVDHGRGWKSSNDFPAYAIQDRKEIRDDFQSPRDIHFESPYKRQSSCEDDQEFCGTGCMPKGADCCSGLAYCVAGTQCTDQARCKSTSTTSTSEQPSATDGGSTGSTQTSVVVVTNTGNLGTSTTTEPQSSSIIEIIRTVTAQPIDGGSGNSNGGVSTGTIAGATVGGVVAGALAMGALWFLLRRRRRRKDHKAGEDGQNKQSEATASPFLSPEANYTGSKTGTELNSGDPLEMECHRSAVQGPTPLAELEQPVQLSELDATQQPQR